MGSFKLIWMVTVRHIFSIAWGYLIHCMILTDPEDDIPKYYPTWFLRAVLSWSFWVPTAVLSYSIYVFHNMFYSIFKGQKWLNSDPKNMKAPVCPTSTAEAYGKWFLLMLLVWVISFVLAMILFVFVEKPAIDARIAFTDNYDPTKSPWEEKPKVEEEIKVVTKSSEGDQNPIASEGNTKVVPENENPI
jgi:peptidoglycan/LPS O-acetylase OafA/YrhL